jgi:DNA-directed RNA polymerase specialized sigma24 family protein
MRRVSNLSRNERTWAALQSLPAPLKTILLLRDVENLPMDEVAARLKLSRPDAERRWARAIVVMTGRLAKPRRKRERV